MPNMNTTNDYKMLASNAMHKLVIARLQNDKRIINKQMSIVEYYTELIMQSMYKQDTPTLNKQANIE